MSNRRRSREYALQALFYMDIRRNASADAFRSFRRCFNPPKAVVPFFERLTKGVLVNRPVLDRLVEQFSSNWKINRMACVDRNILRIAVFEMLYCDDIPVKVSINEAIEIGKRFGTEDSGAFINGILDSIHLAVEDGRIEMGPECKEPLPESPEAGERLLEDSVEDDDKVVLTPIRGRPGVVKRRVISTENRQPETDSVKDGT